MDLIRIAARVAGGQTVGDVVNSGADLEGAFAALLSAKLKEQGAWLAKGKGQPLVRRAVELMVGDPPVISADLEDLEIGTVTVSNGSASASAGFEAADRLNDVFSDAWALFFKECVKESMKAPGERL